MLEIDKIKKTFVLFDKKARELYESNFSKQLKNSGITISGEIDKTVKVERRGPDLESIKSFVITYRNFILDTDPISIRNIAKFYEQVPQNHEGRKAFTKVRTHFNEFLDHTSMIVYNGTKLTYKEVIETYLYGDVIHLRRHDEFAEKTDDYLKKEILFNEIVFILGKAANFIYHFNAINKKLLQDLEKEN